MIQNRSNKTELNNITEQNKTKQNHKRNRTKMLKNVNEKKRIIKNIFKMTLNTYQNQFKKNLKKLVKNW